MQFPFLSTIATARQIVDSLVVGDVVKVRTKAYGETFTTHYVLIEATGTVSDVPFIEFTDLHVGAYNPSLSRRTLSKDDGFWDGITSCEFEDAWDAFTTAKASASKRETQALASYEEAHAEHVGYQMLNDRFGGWL